MNISALVAASHNRSVYCWGAGRYGMMAGDALRRAGVKIAGYIDKAIKSSSHSSIKILHPDELDPQDRVFVVVTSMFFEDEIERALLSKGYAEDRDYILYSNLKRWSIEIDVAGVCQLRCPTCPNGNFTGQRLQKGMMDFALYRKILDKLINEIDFLPDVQLYSWGEPLLNPALPEIVAYSVSQGISVGISSNLNDIRYLKNTIQARPEWFRVSLSGVGDRYHLTHKGGSWDKVSSNIERLGELRARYHPGMVVEINYHLYKNNAKDIELVADICKRNGFLFKPNAAYIDPLDALIEYAEGRPLPEGMTKIASELLLDIDEVVRDCRLNLSASCVLENTIVIHSDGSIRQCPHVFGAQYTLEARILDSSIEKIAQSFQKRDLCKRCKALGLNNFYAYFLDRTDRHIREHSVIDDGGDQT